MKAIFKNLIILFLLSACNNSTENNKNSMASVEKTPLIKETLTSQLEDGVASEYITHDYQKKDLDVTIEILKENLKKNNFIFLMRKPFQIRLKVFLEGQ